MRACLHACVLLLRVCAYCMRACMCARMVQPCCNAAKLPDILKRYLQKFSRGAEADLDDLQ